MYIVFPRRNFKPGFRSGFRNADFDSDRYDKAAREDASNHGVDDTLVMRSDRTIVLRGRLARGWVWVRLAAPGRESFVRGVVNGGWLVSLWMYLSPAKRYLGLRGPATKRG